jgi:hypothetical protein
MISYMASFRSKFVTERDVVGIRRAGLPLPTILCKSRLCWHNSGVVDKLFVQTFSCSDLFESVGSYPWVLYVRILPQLSPHVDDKYSTVISMKPLHLHNVLHLKLSFVLFLHPVATRFSSMSSVVTFRLASSVKFTIYIAPQWVPVWNCPLTSENTPSLILLWTKT